MIFIKSAILGLGGGISNVLPLNKNIIFIFLTMISKTVSGKAVFGIDYSSVFFVNLGILAGVFLYFGENIKKSIYEGISHDFSNYSYEYPYELKNDEKTKLLLPVFYVGCFLGTIIASLFNEVNISYVFLVLLEAVSVVMCFLCDYTKENRVNLKLSALFAFLLVVLFKCLGLSVIPISVIFAKMWGINKKTLFDFTLNVIFVSTLFTTLSLLIKAVIFGFSFAWYLYAVCMVFGALGAFFGAGALKKTIFKNSFRKFGYFHTIFIFIMFYIFISA